jgi:ABC-type bacteriocin/lantibiotic exporter with double-glycine peptidase domain
MSQYPSRSNPREDVRRHNANCGPTSVAMIARAFGAIRPTRAQVDDTIETVRKRGGMPRDQTEGTSVAQLARAARTYGLDADVLGCRGTAAIQKELARGRLVIAHVVPRYLWPNTDTGHYTVVTAIRGGKVYLDDPANPQGPMTVSVRAFNRAIADRGTYVMVSIGAR